MVTLNVGLLKNYLRYFDRVERDVVGDSESNQYLDELFYLTHPDYPYASRRWEGYVVLRDLVAYLTETCAADYDDCKQGGLISLTDVLHLRLWTEVYARRLEEWDGAS